MTEECDRANQEREGLKLADGAALRATLSDRRLPTLSRVNALMTLLERNRHSRDEGLSGVYRPALGRPDETVARLAIEHAPPDDPEVTAKLHASSTTHGRIAGPRLPRSSPGGRMRPLSPDCSAGSTRATRNTATRLGPACASTASSNLTPAAPCSARRGTPEAATTPIGRCWPSACWYWRSGRMGLPGGLRPSGR